MKLETFFEKFDELADTPDAVAKMRKLILTLAARGQLVEQGEPEKPSSRVTTVSIHVEEPPYELPSGWVWKRLGDLADFIGGSQPPKSKFIYQAKEGYTRFVQIRDFKSDANLTFIPTALATRPFNEDDVMIGRYGPPVFQILRGLSGTYNVALMKAEPTSPSLTKDFLFYLLQEPRIQDRVIAESERTAGQSGVRKPLLSSFIIGLPPLAEQKRIVAKVDELMALCDRLEAQQQERESRACGIARASLARFADAPTPANLNLLFHSSFIIPPSSLRKSILTLAVQGKLVPQDPNDEPAEADFEALVRTRENSPLKRTKIDGEATAEDPLIPDSWLGVCLGELVSIRTGFAFKSGDYTEQGTFILRVTNINPDGSFDTSNAVYLPADKLDDKMRGFLLDEHELLVVMVGGSLGKIGQVTAEILPALLNQNMWRLKPYSDRLDYRFLRLVLHDLNENRLQITPSTHGHLAMGTYAAAKVPFPPLAEQRRIVAKVEQLMALVDALETQLAASRATAANLLSALVAELTTAST